MMNLIIEVVVVIGSMVVNVENLDLWCWLMIYWNFIWDVYMLNLNIVIIMFVIFVCLIKVEVDLLFSLC